MNGAARADDPAGTDDALAAQTGGLAYDAPAMTTSPAGPVAVPRPAYRWLVVGALAALALAVFTGHKLLVMAKLRGDLDGIEPRTQRLAYPLRRLSPDTQVFALAEPTQTASTWTIQLTTDQAARHRVGDTIDVRCDGAECYLPDSVYISDGNMQFDAVLLALELGSAAACALVMARRWRRYRAARRGDHLPQVRVRR
jgi:hypothetical protein